FISGSLYSKSELVLRLYNDLGCQSERSIHISPYNKNNYQLFQASSYTLCPNIKTDVTFNTSGLKWPIATHWEYDGQITDSFNAPLNITTPGGLSTKLLRLQVKDDNHCVYKDSIFISGTEDPSFEIQSDKSFCKDSLLTFQIKNLNNPNINNILWTDLSLVIVYQRDSLHLRRQVKTPEYIVASVHDIHNCSYRDTIKIEPIETPDVKIAPLQEVCEGQVIKVVTNTSSPGNIQYQWRINNTKLDSSGSKITWVSPVGSGTIYLSSSNNGACYDFDSVQYTVNPVPVVNIIGDTLYSIYDTIQLQSANQHMLYRWNNNSNLNTSKFSQPANTLGVGLHKIMLRGTNQFYCEASDTISIRIEKPNSIDGNHLNDIFIYPNPASETLSIQTQVPVTFKLMSIGGMVLISGTSEENEFSIDIKGLASGVYFIVINEHCYKFVKT
ncbi:MAG: T9SS type A sorting domain-containing protein, partial [Bacteroidetes bacterium]|nr:T9SS type A sorting domain-containing protein [Bacteroidota bacterium]